MKTKKRFEITSRDINNGWINISGNSHIPHPDDLFAKPILWGLFKWNNDASFYKYENAVSIHKKEIQSDIYVCRPVMWLN